MVTALLPVVIAMVAAQDTVVVVADEPISALSLVEQWRVGSLDGPEHELLGDVWYVTEGTDGTTYVVDVQVPAIRRYDGSGTYLGDLGGEGEGPGEFRGVLGLAPLSGGRVALWDPNLARVSLYSATGEFSQSFPVATQSMIGGRNLSVVSDTSDVLFIPTLSGVIRRVAQTREANFAWLRYNSAGEFQDSLVAPTRMLDGVLAVGYTKSGPRHPFRVHTVSVVGPDGLLVSVRTDAFEVQKSLEDGRVIEVRRSTQPVRPSRGERRQWEALSSDWDERWSMDSPGVPAAKLPLHDLKVDASGRIWALRTVESIHDPDYVDPLRERHDFPPMDWYELETYDVLGPSGEYLGTVTLPERTSLMYARSDRVWCVQRGPFDEQYVVRYRISEFGG